MAFNEHLDHGDQTRAAGAVYAYQREPQLLIGVTRLRWNADEPVERTVSSYAVIDNMYSHVQ